ncbi:ninein-like protein isoform X2 [Moschus berezovskii]|uniref:ninein-like protein isoform X2 n=1 Tax=Moschus berezovskii TaxID=68408 RepID=UPI0024445AFE|nr:ninein-like protein isoform X2 [Moschus berezovskii]
MAACTGPVMAEDESSEEDSLSRFSSKPDVDSWPTSDDEDFDLETKKCRSELSQLHHRVLQLGEEASTHQAQSEKNQLTIQLLTHGLEEAMLQEELQLYGATQRLRLAQSQNAQRVRQLWEEVAQLVPAGHVAELHQLLEGEQRAARRL